MIDWSKQHCGVHQANIDDLLENMPDLKELIKTFPQNPSDFIWDVKVHMLMPSQFPCIPNWHYDNVPRVNNKQDFSLIKPKAPMYLWLSGEPLTEFKNHDRSISKIKPRQWIKFYQNSEHRGTMSKDFQWRGFIRATHKSIMTSNKVGSNCLRRHSQVYLDVNNFSW